MFFGLKLNSMVPFFQHLSPDRAQLNILYCKLDNVLRKPREDLCVSETHSTHYLAGSILIYLHVSPMVT